MAMGDVVGVGGRKWVDVGAGKERESRTKLAWMNTERKLGKG